MLKASLKIYTTNNGEAVSFPINKPQAMIGTYTYDAKRMGSAPTITASLYYPICLDSYWTGKEYVEYKGTRYYAYRKPTSSKSSDTHMYKHEVSFVSERVILESTFFFDVYVDKDTWSGGADAQYKTRYRSNYTEFKFVGNINEFVYRLNDSLLYSGLQSITGYSGGVYSRTGYYIVIDDGVTSENVQVSLDGEYLNEALQHIYNDYGLVYYWVGNVCHVGESEHVLSNTFEYQKGLLSITIGDTNNKIFDRITGVGSSENIPAFYPNDNDGGTALFTATNVQASNVVIDISKVMEYNTSGLYTDTFIYNKYSASSYQFTQTLGSWVNTLPSAQPVEYEDELGRIVTVRNFYHTIMDVYLLSGSTVDLSSIVGSLGIVFEYIKYTTLAQPGGGWYTFLWRHKGTFYKNSDGDWRSQNYVVTRSEVVDGVEGAPVEKSDGVTMEQAGDMLVGSERNIVVNKYENTNIEKVSSAYEASEEGWYSFMIRTEAKSVIPKDVYHTTGDLKPKSTLSSSTIPSSTYTIKHTPVYSEFFAYGSKSVNYASSGISFVSKEGVPSRTSTMQLDTTTEEAGYPSHNIKTVVLSGADSAAKINISSRQYITPCKNLMPSIYIDSDGKSRFYDARNYLNADTYKYPLPNGMTKDYADFYVGDSSATGKARYYDFETTYDTANPMPYEGKQDFSDIKPSIVGVKNSRNELFGSIAAVAFDAEDNDQVKSDGSNEYVHPYFYIKLHRFNGEYGFNLFKQAIENSAATINMTSGDCSACAFEIAVYEPNSDNVFYNPVKTDALGNLSKVDGATNGDYILPATNIETMAVERQQNTAEYEVWIAVKKDTSTFNVLMPSASNNYRPKVGDTFVITGIKLPTPLIRAAEAKLSSALVKYMNEQNKVITNISITLSRNWLRAHSGDDVCPDGEGGFLTLSEVLNENMQLNVKYAGKTISGLYVSNITCKADDNILEEVDIELSAKLSVNTSQTESQSDALKQDIIDSISGMGNSNTLSMESILSYLRNYFLSKVKNDVASKLIEFADGLRSNIVEVTDNLSVTGTSKFDDVVSVGSFEDHENGHGIRMTPQGEIVAQDIRTWGSLTVNELRFNRASVMLGTNILTYVAGVIEECYPMTVLTGICKLQLEDEDTAGTIQEGALCVGYFHDYSNDNDTADYDDHAGNIKWKGTRKVQFAIEKIYSSSDTNPMTGEAFPNNSQWFYYELRDTASGGNGVHPQVGMTFKGTGNNKDQTKGNFWIQTPAYRAAYTGIQTWNWNANNLVILDADDARGFESLFGYNGSWSDITPKRFTRGDIYYTGSLVKYDLKDTREITAIQSSNGIIKEGESETVKIEIRDGNFQLRNKEFLVEKNGTVIANGADNISFTVNFADLTKDVTSFAITAIDSDGHTCSTTVCVRRLVLDGNKYRIVPSVAVIKISNDDEDVTPLTYDDGDTMLLDDGSTVDTATGTASSVVSAKMLKNEVEVTTPNYLYYSIDGGTQTKVDPNYNITVSDSNTDVTFYWYDGSGSDKKLLAYTTVPIISSIDVKATAVYQIDVLEAKQTSNELIYHRFKVWKTEGETRTEIKNTSSGVYPHCKSSEDDRWYDGMMSYNGTCWVCEHGVEGQQKWMAVGVFKKSGDCYDSDEMLASTVIAMPDNGIVLSVDKPSVSMMYRDGSYVGDDIVVTAKLMNGNEDVTSDASWSTYSTTNVNVVCTNNMYKITGISSTNGNVVIKAIYNNLHYVTTINVQRVAAQSRYELILTPDAISYNKTTEEISNTSIAMTVYKTDGATGSRGIVSNLVTEGIHIDVNGTDWQSGYAPGVQVQTVAHCKAGNKSFDFKLYKLNADNTKNILVDRSIAVSYSANGSSGVSPTVYSIECATDNIVYDTTTGTYNPSTVDLYFYKTVGNSKTAYGSIGEMIGDITFHYDGNESETWEQDIQLEESGKYSFEPDFGSAGEMLTDVVIVLYNGLRKQISVMRSNERGPKGEQGDSAVAYQLVASKTSTVENTQSDVVTFSLVKITGSTRTDVQSSDWTLKAISSDAEGKVSGKSMSATNGFVYGKTYTVGAYIGSGSNEKEVGRFTLSVTAIGLRGTSFNFVDWEDVKGSLPHTFYSDDPNETLDSEVTPRTSGKSYIGDILLYNGKKYLCTKSYVQKNTNISSMLVSNWTEVSWLGNIATNLLLAEKSIIKNLILNSMNAYAKNADGTWDTSSPSISIDGDTGRLTARNGYFEGTIRATNVNQPLNIYQSRDGVNFVTDGDRWVHSIPESGDAYISACDKVERTSVERTSNVYSWIVLPYACGDIEGRCIEITVPNFERYSDGEQYHFLQIGITSYNDEGSLIDCYAASQEYIQSSIAMQWGNKCYGSIVMGSNDYVTETDVSSVSRVKLICTKIGSIYHWLVQDCQNVRFCEFNNCENLDN